MEELDVVGIAAGSLRLQPSEFIESRKDEEAMARGAGALRPEAAVGVAEDRIGRVRTDRTKKDTWTGYDEV